MHTLSFVIEVQFKRTFWLEFASYLRLFGSGGNRAHENKSICLRVYPWCKQLTLHKNVHPKICSYFYYDQENCFCVQIWQKEMSLDSLPLFGSTKPVVISYSEMLNLFSRFWPVFETFKILYGIAPAWYYVYNNVIHTAKFMNCCSAAIGLNCQHLTTLSKSSLLSSTNFF